MLNTARSDYDPQSIPDFVVLTPSDPQHCLRIPTVTVTVMSGDELNDPRFFTIRIFPDTEQIILEQTIVEVNLFENCVHGDVRLVNGISDLEGRVELCLDNVFGTICDVTLWTLDDANAVCEQLGLDLDAGTAIVWYRTSRLVTFNATAFQFQRELSPVILGLLE